MWPASPQNLQMQKNVKSAKRNMIFGFGISLFFLLLSSGISYFSITQLLTSQQWVEHTTEVSSSLNNLISLMKDAETGQRGYLLTGDETFLEPYKGSDAKVMAFYTSAQRLTRDNKSQQEDFPLLEKLIKEKYTLIEKTISDKKQGITPSVSHLLRGKAIMDSVRVVIKVMNGREDKLMILRTKKVNKFAVLTPLFIGIAALVGMFVTLVFYRKIQQNAAIATRLEQELQAKEKTMERQIEVISNVARKISSGDYQARIEEKDLE
jgi:CHASE3 domain sensor protein